MSVEYDWKGVSVSLAADNARLLEIGLKADALAAAVKKYMAVCSTPNFAALEHALDAYNIARQGQ